MWTTSVTLTFVVALARSVAEAVLLACNSYLPGARRRKLNLPDSSEVADLFAPVSRLTRRMMALGKTAREVRRVLILNVMGQLSSPGVALMDQAIVAGLQKSKYQIELYNEDLEATLFPDEVSQRQFREWYMRKYRDRKPDVIIAVGLEPLKFMTESHEKSFSGIPIIFCGTTKEMLGQLKLDSS